MKNKKFVKKSVSSAAADADTFKCSMPVFSADADEKCVKVMSFNVSGIPVIGTFQGTKKIGGFKKSSAIGKILNKVDFDMIGVQEDFNFHQGLEDEMTLFPHRTYTSGSLPLGDGLNIFSKHPIYNVDRNNWDKLYGVLCGANDRLSKKGFVYTVAEIESGVFVDFIVLHADAGRDKHSVYARKDNFRQVTEFINSREHDRPLIVIGDFNTAVSRQTSDDIYNNFIAPTGVKEVWAELHNNGRYVCGDEVWDNEAIDKVFYKSAGGVAFEPSNIRHICLTDEEGLTYTDHRATCARLTYKVNKDELLPASAEMKKPEPFDVKQRSRDLSKALCSSVFLVFTHLHELLFLIHQLWHENFDSYPKY
ncbi:MAG: hypothetical protein GX107_07295 [Clostridiales bacterium]|nr:hypothetical protein [Clostridiales bacterium]